MLRFGMSSRRKNQRPDPDIAWQSIDWARHCHEMVFRGRRVHYTEMGSGPAVVLIHGQGGCWKWWLRQIPELAHQARVVAVDLPGFGESDPVGDGADVYGEHVATVVALLDHLQVARATIVGHSMGGIVAVQLACDHPGRVSGLVMTNAGGANINAERLRWVLAALRLFNTAFSVRWVARMTARSRTLRSLLFATMLRDRRALTKPLAAEILPKMSAPGFVPSLEAGAVAVNRVTPHAVVHPCLIIWGMEDRILPAAAGYELLSQFPDARLVPLHGVGHCPMFEVPDRFNELVAGFVREPSHNRPGFGPSAIPAVQSRRCSRHRG